MNCSTHTEVPAVAFCRSCGRALCADCRRVADGVVYCAEHAMPPTATASSGGAPYSDTPYRNAPATPLGHAHPRLAFVLGLIPGVGAIYNGQYAKGLVHAIVFGLLISIINSRTTHGLEPLFGILIAAFILYMAFEAHHTARRRNAGEAVDEFSGLSPHSRPGRSSGSAVALIVLGAVFLLNTLGVVELHQILRFWPLLLIGLGVNMLHSRISDSGKSQSNMDPNREVNHERQ